MFNLSQYRTLQYWLDVQGVYVCVSRTTLPIPACTRMNMYSTPSLIYPLS